MLNRFDSRTVKFAIALMALALFISGCSKDDGKGAVMDGTSWSLVDTYVMKVPGAVWPVSSGVVIVGADEEHIYRSTNGGRGWSYEVLNSTLGRKPLDIYFTPTRGIMVGQRGLLYTSTNNGVTWTDVSIPRIVEEEIDLRNIIYPATGENSPFFVVGQSGALLKSTNQGASWTEVNLNIITAESTMVIDEETGDTTWDHTPVYLNQELIDFTGGHAPTASRIYALGDTLSIDSEFYLYYSKNGGNTWGSLRVPLGGAFKECYFSDDTIGMVFGPDGAIWRVRTTNDTIRHSNIAILGSGKNITGVEFVTPSIGWAIGAGGLVAKTINGGTNWTSINVDVTGSIADIGFLNENEGWIVGNDALRGTGAIKVTTDGGANWFFKSYGLGLTLNTVHFISSTEGWIAGKSGRIAHTTDGGRMWLHQDTKMDKTLQNIFFLDENRGWAVGFSTNNYLDTLMTILRTTNGGDNWTSIMDLPGQRLNSVKFANANSGWAVGNKGLIVRSEDGGLTWTTQTSGVLAELFGISLISAQEAIVVGQYGTILKTTNGGSTWAALPSGTQQSLTGIDMVSSSVGYVCGSLGTVLKTTDGGSSWQLLDLPNYSETVFKSIAFVNAEVGWAVGKFGYILHTADGGATWYRQEAGFSEEALNEVFILDAQHAWIVGDNSIFMELNP